MTEFRIIALIFMVQIGISFLVVLQQIGRATKDIIDEIRKMPKECDCGDQNVKVSIVGDSANE
jgi:hypothetical protein